MGKRAGVVGAVVLMAVIAGLVAVQPILTFREFKSALIAKDEEAIRDTVDFPALKEALHERVSGQMRLEAEKEFGASLEPSLMSTLGAVVIRNMVDEIGSPSGLISLIDRWANGDSSLFLSEMEYWYASPSRFVLVRTAEDGTEHQLVFRRQGLDWRLTTVLWPLAKVINSPQVAESSGAQSEGVIDPPQVAVSPEAESEEVIESSSAVEPIRTRFGELSSNSEGLLTFNGSVVVQQVFYGDDPASEVVVNTFRLPDADVILIQQGQGNACPGNYAFVTVSHDGVTATKNFGTCYDERTEPVHRGDEIYFSMPKLSRKGVSTFTYKNGNVMETHDSPK